jgi:Tfp pilus assembly protein PilN
LIKINLLPPEIARRRKIRQIAIMFGTMSAMYVGLLVVVFILLSGRIALVNRELEQKKMELQRYSAQLSQVATLRNAISNLEEKLNFKSKVVEANNKWIALLDLIRLHTPKDVWITAIDIAPPDGVVLSCSTLGGAKSIATCNLSFMNCKEFKDVTIDTTSFTVPKKGVAANSTVQDAGKQTSSAAPGMLPFKVTLKLVEPVGLPKAPAPAPEAGAEAEAEQGNMPSDGGADSGGMEQ